MYESSIRTASCCFCKHKQYDTSNRERWCGHKPLPAGIGAGMLIDRSGTCEFWDLDIATYPELAAEKA